ncbi:MAG: argininosuccinate lyase, partial [Firmicutes bacterium]|nr:argininosuccinate lyase [Bacillota bacterium]
MKDSSQTGEVRAAGSGSWSGKNWSGKAWSGRFAKGSDPQAERFGASIGFDIRLLPYDIEGSQAHVRALQRAGVLSAQEAETLLDGLAQVYRDLSAERVGAPETAWELDPADEDVHMLVERLLAARVGEVGKKLHTGRSRNDQVALDTRLYVRDVLGQVAAEIRNLLATLLELAERHADWLMPGFTHLQPAQPVLLSHHLLAYGEMFWRDAQRLAECYGRTNVLPLGAAALAGTAYPIDRAALAAELGFAAPSENSLDAVSDRDFVLDFAYAAAMIMMHLSRLAEELVLWSSPAFAFVEIDDAYATGSSIMPQKKNPDTAELVRGKTGRVLGHLTGLLTMMKGLPLAYNKDLQEDKEALFDTADTVLASLRVFTPMLATLRFDRARLAAAAGEGFSTATEVADYLARRGVPFREAHRVTGQIVRHCLEHGCGLADLTLEEWRRFSPAFGPDILAAIQPEAAVAARNVYGGTAP